MKKTSLMVGSLILASLGNTAAANAAGDEAAPALCNSLAADDCGAVALSADSGAEQSPLTSSATTSFIRTVAPIGANHNGTLLRASRAKPKSARAAARRRRSASA